MESKIIKLPALKEESDEFGNFQIKPLVRLFYYIKKNQI